MKKNKIKKVNFFLMGLLLIPIITYSQVYKNPNAPVEDRVKDILSCMTLEEKIDYIGGINHFFIRSIPHLGLPEIKMSDGPVGVRTFGKSTAYPASILTAATWDTELAKKLGSSLGNDCRARGVHILLGPGVNICRVPICGRNFEYMGEDPFLTSRMAVAYIQGVQGQGVSACVKHFAGNNQELNRTTENSNIDERTLQEIYLSPFKAAITEGNVGAVMDSYNLLNGEHATQNNHLNNKILKNQWGFDGILMSDWGATHDGLAAALGGLDLEMPSGKYMSRENMLPAIKKGELTEAEINDKVSRILRIIFRFGFYDHSQEDSSILLDNPASDQVALDVAREGIVLLKNEANILPLNSNSIKTVAVIGPNAAEYAAGGGSSNTTPFHFTTPLDEITEEAGNQVKTNYKSGIPSVSEMVQNATYYTEKGSEETGLKGEYFNNRSLSGTPVATRIDQKINFNWGVDAPNLKNITKDNFSIRWTGIIRPETSGTYRFAIKGDDGFRLFIDNKPIIESWHDQGTTLRKNKIYLEEGKEYAIRMEYFENSGSAEIHVGYANEGKAMEEAAKCAFSSDVAIVCVGFNGEEGEGGDRSFSLPSGQNELINAVAAANKNTVVVINAGGNIDMQPWISNVKGLLYMWYGGQEGGKALAEILFGKVNPSGKLPDTFAKNWESNPIYESYENSKKSLSVDYTEGLLVGYRYYDTKGIEPEFPFGYGLSYTTYSYSNLKIEKIKNDEYEVHFDIKNTGEQAGAEIAQVYVKALNLPVAMPEKELKGFARINLKSGEKKQVSILLNRDAFSYYNVDEKQFVVGSGKFQILVGASSRDLKLWKGIDIAN